MTRGLEDWADGKYGDRISPEQQRQGTGQISETKKGVGMQNMGWITGFLDVKPLKV